MPAPILDLDLPPDHPIRQILAAIEAHPEVREPVLRALLTEDFLALPGQVQGVSERVDGLGDRVDGLGERMDGLSGRVDGLTDRVDGLNDRVDGLNDRVDGLSGRVDGLTERVDGLSGRMDGLTERVDGLREDFDGFREETREQFATVNERIDESARTVIRRVEGSIGRLRGGTYESQCAAAIDAILVDHFHHAVEADRETVISRMVQARHDRLISREEYLDARNVDIIAHEKPAQGVAEHLAAVEVTITFNRDDLETAARRAAIIGRVFGLRTDAFVATNGAWPDEVDEVALQLGVTIVRHFLPEFAADQI